jgi:hypothetical protein
VQRDRPNCPLEHLGINGNSGETSKSTELRVGRTRIRIQYPTEFPLRENSGKNAVPDRIPLKDNSSKNIMPDRNSPREDSDKNAVPDRISPRENSDKNAVPDRIPSGRTWIRM